MSGIHLEHDWFPDPVPENVILGQRSWLYSSFAFVHCISQRAVALRVGHDTGVYNPTFFNLGPHGEVEVGNYCTLVGAIICSNARIVIGDYALLAHEVVLADSPYCVPSGMAAGAAAKPGEVEVTEHGETSIVLGENVWVGARAILLRGARIGEGSIIGAAAVVDFEVPPFSLVAGNPGRVVRSLR